MRSHGLELAFLRAPDRLAYLNDEHRINAIGSDPRFGFGLRALPLLGCRCVRLVLIDVKHHTCCCAQLHSKPWLNPILMPPDSTALR